MYNYDNYIHRELNVYIIYIAMYIITIIIYIGIYIGSSVLFL